MLEPSKTGYTLSVTEPVILELAGETEVQLGEEYVINGVLLNSRREPLPGRPIGLTLPQGVTTSVKTNDFGRFEFRNATDQPGRYEIEASFVGDGLLEHGRSGYTLGVIELVDLDLVGDDIVRVGDAYRLEGTLSGAGGMRLEGQILTIHARGMEPVDITTDTLGSFAWETTFDEETTTSIRVRYGGTDEYAPIQTSLSVEAARVELVVEEPEPVARGESLLIRGLALMNGQTVTNAAIQVNGEEYGATNAAGVFVVRVSVPPNAPLGQMDWTVSALGLDSRTTVSTNVMSRVGVLVTPLDDVKQGRSALVEANLLDDRGAGIPNAKVNYADGKTAVTNELGAALLEVDIPDEGVLASVPLRVSYGGDEIHLPVTYLANLQVESGGLGWLVWVALPLLLAVGVGAGYLGSRRFRGRTVLASARAPSVISSDSMASPAASSTIEGTELAVSFVGAFPDSGNAWQVGEEINLSCTLTDQSGRRIAEAKVMVRWEEGESAIELVTDRKGSCRASWTGERPGQYRVTAEFAGTELYRGSRASAEFELRVLAPTHLELSFDNPADNLPPIWGVGEPAGARVALMDDAGRGLKGRSIVLSIEGASGAEELITDETGRCRLDLPADVSGVYGVEARFEGDEGLLPSQARGKFEVVEFRDDIVRRYNSFLAAARRKAPRISPKATPREVEALIVASGMTLDQRALEELIARFEEADYSEHEITRRQFEAAYHAWQRLERVEP